MHHALKVMEDPEALQTAIFYQLVSPYTNYLVVDEIADEQKGQELPALRKVPQMLAAGHGGMGSVYNLSVNMDACHDIGSEGAVVCK